MNTQKDVSVIMGSDSDLGAMRGALDTLEKLGISYEVGFVSAHRTAEDMAEHARTARARGFKVIIAGAGGSAHLPGMTEAFAKATIPVIGVPVRSDNFDGWDAVLSIIQMPPGRPVGMMGVNGSRNAAIYAAQILSIADASIAQRVEALQEEMANEVRGKNEILRRVGYKDYPGGKKS